MIEVKQELWDKVDDWFTYKAPSSNEVMLTHERVTAHFKDFAHELCEMIPDSAELTLMLRKLQEARSWAHTAIAEHQDLINMPDQTENSL